MKNILLVLALFSILWGGAFGARAEDGGGSPITLNRIDFDLVDPPVYAATTGIHRPPTGPSEAPKWVEIDFTFNVHTERPFLNETEFRIYVEVTDTASATGPQAAPEALVAETTYLNLTNGTAIPGAFFIHPSTIRRFGGESAFNFNGANNIRIVALVDGEQVASIDKHQDDSDWVNSLKKINGLVLPKELSPWALLYLDRYPATKIRGLGVPVSN